MNLAEVKYDCIHFKGHIPCKPNKEHGVLCSNCDFYKTASKKILIIKLGAIGDVIRTTPLLECFRKNYPGAQFTWLSLFPDVLPKSEDLEILKLDEVNLFKLHHRSFDMAINLDKDEEACQLLSKVEATEKLGFSWNKHISPATPAAEHKLLTGFFDSLSQENTKSYLEEIFEICHQKFAGEEYQIRINPALGQTWSEQIKKRAGGKKIIGLNTGCGPRWKTRLWPQSYWIKLIQNLMAEGYFCMVLGGKAEDEVNRYYANETGAYYPGHFSLEEFISISNSCHLIVTQVSLMMHIAIALKKQLVLMNNIFNAHEFELYGRGEIVEPASGCDCYYGNSCSREKSCMNDIEVEQISSSIEKFI